MVGATTEQAQSGLSFNNLNQNTAYSFDERGNQLTGSNGTYTWDAADRMTRFAGGLIRADYAYDASGRRTEKRVFTIADDETATVTPDQGKSRRFAWDGQKIEAEFDLGNHLLITYAWSPAGGLLAVTDHRGTIPITYRVIQDGTGSVVGLIAPDGSIAATYRYDPYGRQLEASGPAADVCGYRFAGGYWDEESRLQDHCRRYYSPEDGRWLSRDPIAEQGGVNVYGYCGGDPINRADPSGLDSVPGYLQIWNFVQAVTTIAVNDPDFAKRMALVTAKSAADEVGSWVYQKAADNAYATNPYNPQANFVYKHGIVAGGAKAIGDMVIGTVELKESVIEAGSWLATGNAYCPPQFSVIPELGPHALSRGTERLYTTATAGVRSLDPRAFGAGEFAGNAGVQALSIASAVVPLLEFGEAATIVNESRLLLEANAGRSVALEATLSAGKLPESVAFNADRLATVRFANELSKAAEIPKAESLADLITEARDIARGIEARNPGVKVLASVDAHDIASSVAGRFPTLKCFEAANAVESALTNAGAEGLQVRLDFLRTREGLVGSLSKQGDLIGTTGYHVGTMIDGTVYCPVHPRGLPFPEWVMDFAGAGDFGPVPDVRISGKLVGGGK